MGECGESSESLQKVGQEEGLSTQEYSLDSAGLPRLLYLPHLPCVWAQPQGFTPANSILEASWIKPQAATRSGSCVPCGQPMRSN